MLMAPGIFVAAYLLDLVIGDPVWIPHPVRLFGWTIAGGERLLRRHPSGKGVEFCKGLLLTSFLVSTAGFGSLWLVKLAGRYSPGVAIAISIYLAWACVATRSLLHEANEVGRCLRDSRDLGRARLQVAKIVGRDTANLNQSEIARATIETLAESACDAIVAPLFFLALGGAPAAIAYKAIDTLDSMIGHNNLRYAWFGKAAARLDDATNF